MNYLYLNNRKPIDDDIKDYIMNFSVRKNNVNASIAEHLKNSSGVLQFEFELLDLKHIIRINRRDDTLLVNLYKTINSSTEHCNHEELEELYKKFIKLD